MLVWFYFFFLYPLPILLYRFMLSGLVLGAVFYIAGLTVLQLYSSLFLVASIYFSWFCFSVLYSFIYTLRWGSTSLFTLLFVMYLLFHMLRGMLSLFLLFQFLCEVAPNLSFFFQLFNYALLPNGPSYYFPLLTELVGLISHIEPLGITEGGSNPGRLDNIRTLAADGSETVVSTGTNLSVEAFAGSVHSDTDGSVVLPLSVSVPLSSVVESLQFTEADATDRGLC